MAFGACQLNALLCYAGNDTECYYYVVGVIALNHFITNFVLLHLAVFLLQTDIHQLVLLRQQVQGGDEATLLTLGGTVGSPVGILGHAGTLCGQVDLLHHLTQGTVGQDHGGVAVLERKVKAKCDEIGQLLDR